MGGTNEGVLKVWVEGRLGSEASWIPYFMQQTPICRRRMCKVEETEARKELDTYGERQLLV